MTATKLVIDIQALVNARLGAEKVIAYQDYQVAKDEALETLAKATVVKSDAKWLATLTEEQFQLQLSDATFQASLPQAYDTGCGVEIHNDLRFATQSALIERHADVFGKYAELKLAGNIVEQLHAHADRLKSQVPAMLEIADQYLAKAGLDRAGIAAREAARIASKAKK